jgi:hypothetical protein
VLTHRDFSAVRALRLTAPSGTDFFRFPAEEAEMHIPPDQISPYPGGQGDTTAVASPMHRTLGHGQLGARAPPRLLEGYVSGEELQLELGVGGRTLRKWRQVGSGPPFVKVGHNFYYPLDEFRKWLKKRTVTAGGR